MQRYVTHRGKTEFPLNAKDGHLVCNCWLILPGITNEATSASHWAGMLRAREERQLAQKTVKIAQDGLTCI